MTIPDGVYTPIVEFSIKCPQVLAWITVAVDILCAVAKKRKLDIT
jgi:hypothetical protein